MPSLLAPTLLRTALLAALSLALPNAASAQALYITDCSLGCTGGAAGQQVFCGVVNVHENEVIEIGFSEPVDPASLSAQTFSVVDISNGTTPAGNLRVAPFDARRVIFEPQFIPQGGGVAYAFGRDRSYEIRISGTAQGDAGPFITSVAGQSNTSRMLCTVFTSEGLLPPFRNECVTTPNSVGPGAMLSASGSSSLFLNDMTLSVDGMPANTFGLFIIGSDSVVAPLGLGTRCVGGVLSRLDATPIDAMGMTSYDFDVGATGPAVTVTVGSTWYLQYVYRDAPQGVPTFTTSDSVRVQFYP